MFVAEFAANGEETFCVWMALAAEVGEEANDDDTMGEEMEDKGELTVDVAKEDLS